MTLRPFIDFAGAAVRTAARVALRSARLARLRRLERERARLVTVEVGLWRDRLAANAQRAAVRRHGVELQIMDLRRRLDLPLMAPRAASLGVRLRRVA